MNTAGQLRPTSRSCPGQTVALPNRWRLTSSALEQRRARAVRSAADRQALNVLLWQCRLASSWARLPNLAAWLRIPTWRVHCASAWPRRAATTARMLWVTSLAALRLTRSPCAREWCLCLASSAQRRQHKVGNEADACDCTDCTLTTSPNLCARSRQCQKPDDSKKARRFAVSSSFLWLRCLASSHRRLACSAEVAQCFQRIICS